MFNWLSKRRRKKLAESPFPPVWEDIMRRNVAHYCMLDAVEQAHLRALIQVFIAVATEQFFDQPIRMAEHAPDLYRVLKEYYRQDPAERVNRNTCTVS